jgi:hypothetical protein
VDPHQLYVILANGILTDVIEVEIVLQSVGAAVREADIAPQIDATHYPTLDARDDTCDQRP